jgi:hypothetical protein
MSIMARKRQKTTQAPVALIKSEVWEIGRRALDIHVADLDHQGERPEVLLAVQTGESGGVVLVDAITSSTPTTALKDFALQAMRQPLLGQPRRPEVIRVSSQAEAEVLAVALTTTGVALEVSSQLATLDAVHEHIGTMLGGLDSDYCRRAAQVGETLSEESLHAFFRTARMFFREAIWRAYGDEVVFEIALQPAQGPAKTLYGVLLGNLGQEFGLALYPSLDDFRQFYELSLEHLDQLTGPPPELDEEEIDPEQWQEMAEMTAQFMAISSVTLTYSPQQDTPPSLVQEAIKLKLPLANKSAFPVVMRTGQNGMQIATATDLGDMLSSMRAILAWDKRIDYTDGEDEVDITITSKLKAVKGFLPAITAHITLRDNPCLPEEDDDAFLPSLSPVFEALFTEPSGRTTSSQGKKGGKTSSDKRAKPTGEKATTKTASSKRVYTLNVYLVDGPMSEQHTEQEISRLIDIRGNQTLHDLHGAIFEAFERWEEHLYEFNLGMGPANRSQIYFYTGGRDTDDDKGGEPEATVLDTLDLSVGRRFGYTFDMGDQWEHVIEVIAIKEGTGKGTYPRVTKKVGTAPPQYPEDEEDL